MHRFGVGVLAVVAEDPVNCQIGIAADRGSEVGIVFQCQTEVSDRFRSIGCLCHGTQHHDIQNRIQFSTPCVVQNLRQMTGLDVGEYRHFDTQPQQDLFQTLDLFRRGLVVHTIDKGQVLFPCHFCGSFVCQQHHFLDDALALAPFPCHNVHADTLVIDDQCTLCGFQFRSTAAFPFPQANVAQFVHQRDHVLNSLVLFQQLRRSGAGEDLVDLAVNAFDSGTDHGLPEFVLDDLTVFVQVHQGGECQTVFAGVQGADAVGQAGGQHGNNAVCIVDAGAAIQCFVVQRGVRADVVGNVCDVHAQTVAGFGLFQRNGIVQVLGLGTVNGEDRGFPQVQTLCVFLLRNGSICQLVGFGNDFFRKVHVDTANGNHCFGTDACTGADTKAEHDLDLVLGVPLTAVNHFCQHLFALVIDHAVLSLDLNGSLGHGVRTEHQLAVVLNDNAGHLAVCFLQNRQHFAFRLAAAGGNVADEDAVPGHGTL